MEIAVEIEDDGGTCVRLRVELGLNENKTNVVKVQKIFYYTANNKVGMAICLIHKLYMSFAPVGILLPVKIH